VLGARVVVDAAGGALVSGLASSSWEDLPAIAGFIREQKPKAVVYGLPINTIAQLKAIPENAELVSLLTSRYEVRDIGPFEVWLRRR
jgi:hypothetical protein